MKRILIPILISVVLIMGACGEVTEEQTIKEEATEEEVVEEEAIEEEVVEEEVIEEEVVEEEVTEEEAAEPTPEPAKFVLNNLRITLDESETEYSISVDITNIGGLRGDYQGRAKVDGENMDLINIKLDPGEKRTVTLTEAQNRISLLATQYKNGDIDQQECDISIGSCSETVTFPKPRYMLKLLYSRGMIGFGNRLAITGGVKNISNESLADVEVLIEFYDADQKLIATVSGLIYKNPLEPDQTSSFDIESSGPASNYLISFRFKGGNEILTDFSETNWKD